jgi:hypothetical protein
LPFNGIVGCTKFICMRNYDVPITVRVFWPFFISPISVFNPSRFPILSTTILLF